MAFPDICNGVKFAIAHDLAPMAILHFQLASDNGSVENSVIYQNPGWPTVSGSAPNGY